MIGRELPHSLEAEEYLLSACLIDGNETIAAAVAEGVTGSSFFSPANSIIWQRTVELYHQHGSVDAASLAEELIDRVKELENKRSLIRFAGDVVERAFDNDAGASFGDFITELEDRIDTAKRGERADEGRRSLVDFDLPPEDDESALLGRNRYICRGDQAIIVSSAGMGKSSLSLEWAVCCALGRPFMGIETKKPLKSLIIQAEDSDGDVGEVWFSIRHSLKLTEAQIEQVKQHVVIIRDKVNRGPAFISRLRVLLDKVKPDLVWLNPLHAYAPKLTFFA